VNHTPSPDPTEVVRRFLIEHSLLAPVDALTCTSLAGGVSSDIWRVDTPGGALCVKRALPTLRVAARWEAPVSRNAHEWAWLNFAFACQPQAVPRPFAHDPQAGLFAMAYLPPADYPVWKQQLLEGHTEPTTAQQIGAIVAALHNASAGREAVARQFDTLDTFNALRLDPYLLATAERHPGVARELRDLADRTGRMRVALVHGDVSPKNILVGPQGPVILDAECAWYGDPAFDIAFCLTHLLLKGVVRPDRRDVFLRDFEALANSYLNQIRFERPETLDARAAQLLSALLLARIDGKSPVEYLLGQPERQQRVRDIVLPLIATRVGGVLDVAHEWRRQMAI
jgi:aminoglycoside phosphotransferase (APT) family kinase protein